MRAIRARRGLLGAVVVLVVLASPGSAHADAVTDWNQVAAAALQSPGTATPPGAGQGAASTVHLAMVHGAVYDAVNAIDGGHEPYASSPAALPWYSQEAAVAAAARGVLVNGGLGIPAARMPVIEAAYQSSLAAIPDGPAKAGGIATGQAAAIDMLAARVGDGRFGSFLFPVGSLPGEWRPTSGTNDPGAWLKDVTPFVLRDPDLFRGRPPHDLGSRAYAADFNEVKAIGSALGSTRTPDQTAAAQYWGLTNATATMASIIRSIANGQGGTLADRARLLARAYTNASDALIVTWRDKARHGFWRPVTAIREAAADGNAATEADPAWTSLIAAPPYPDHPSGLATFGSAVMDTMRHFYGRDEATFSGTTPGGVTRQFTSFSQLRDDIVEARIWSGIHFRFADEEAAKIGRKVAHWGNRHAFR
ncbi:MAG TPA: vanadium-dependent haloperoxidase [Thermoleophilaceae bacterium]|nr:vanadium-dependent haloperoxidase [Thermoleophilaceae bacterium]